MRERRKNKETFFRKYWVVFICTFLVTAASYYPKIRYFNYSIDTERMIRLPDYTLDWWLKLGRYGLVALSKIPFFGEGVHVRYINILTYLLLFVSVLFLSYVFDKETKRSRIELFLAISLYVTTPVVLEQTNFVLQSAPVVFSTVIMFIGYGLLKIYIENKNYWLLLSGLIFVMLSFTVYVSLVLGFVALTIVDICYQSRKEVWGIKKYFSRVMYFAGASIISYGGYLIGNIVCLKVFNLKSSEYLLESKLWGTVPNAQVYDTIKSSLINNFEFDSPFAFWGVMVLLTLFIVLSILNKENIVITLITLVGIVVIGTYTVPLLGYFGTLRSYFPVYPILLYGLAMLIFQSARINLMKVSSYLFIFVLVAVQGFNTFRFGVNEEKIYQQEVALVKEIEIKLKENSIEDISEYKLAIIGGKTFEEITHGDMLGNTVFAWDLTSNVGTSYRAGDFIYNHGLHFKRITPKEYAKAIERSNDMTIFPDNQSIKIVEEILIIKLS
ncbi:glucosyltransferase domain-containing protein [Enterococcus hulanensis]|uniref:glucosyltransferase domain-containing protein n=1 Tax=Enterococcus hulanensis TaxID=2559929 RepID=UPI001A8FE471|nr:glucosyltransferase domain-containing protein [Enterococcus hulanensis]MBO0457473.1 glucosyltransferase domain-containing protein [Enterococcus hulanensis]